MKPARAVHVLVVVTFATAVAGSGCTVRDRRPGRPFGPRGYGAPQFSGPEYGMAGCGLGSVIFGPDNSPGAQLSAATTNGTSGTQITGITSGTWNCSWNGLVRAEREQSAFAEINFQDLKRDLAVGGGEFLSSFATLLGCDEGAKPTFYSLAQSRYEAILPTSKTTPVELTGNLKRMIKSDERLALRCTDARAVARTEDVAAGAVDTAMLTESAVPAARK